MSEKLINLKPDRAGTVDRDIAEQAMPPDSPTAPTHAVTSVPPALKILNMEELLTLNVKPRGHILEPIIPEQGLVMVHASRGIGKTYFAFTIAYAVASGGRAFNRWDAKEPHSVLYLDGEMPLASVQERIRNLVEATGYAPSNPNSLRFLTPDMQTDWLMPNLATEEGQDAIEPFVQDADLIIVDNLATLARTGKANSEDEWWPVQSWLLRMRHRGKSALIVHHDGKGQTQRGTSSKEDILDTVIQLKRPSDYDPQEGARFEVILTKARGIVGAEAESFEAKLVDDCRWEVRTLEDALEKTIQELDTRKMSVREIADAVGCSHSTVQRICKKLGLPTRGIKFRKE